MKGDSCGAAPLVSGMKTEVLKMVAVWEPLIRALCCYSPTEPRCASSVRRHGAQDGGRPLQDLWLPNSEIFREGRGEIHAAAAPEQRQDHRVHAQVSHTRQKRRIYFSILLV